MVIKIIMIFISIYFTLMKKKTIIIVLEVINYAFRGFIKIITIFFFFLIFFQFLRFKKKK